jgi:protein-tyrosine-phosphatase
MFMLSAVTPHTLDFLFVMCNSVLVGNICRSGSAKHCLESVTSIQVKVKVTLRPTTSRSVSPGFKAHEGLTT